MSDWNYFHYIEQLWNYFKNIKRIMMLYFNFLPSLFRNKTSINIEPKG